MDTLGIDASPEELETMINECVRFNDCLSSFNFMV